MMNIGESISSIRLYTARILMKLFYVFPIEKNKVFFSSYEGKQFSCNPKYVFLKLQEGGECFKIVYEYNDVKHAPEELEGVTIVRHNSFPYFFHLLTAKVIVSNNAISPKIPVRKSQYVINTWHGGGAFKKVGIDIDSKVNGMNAKLLKLTAKQTSLFLASSEGFYEGTGKGSCIPMDKVHFVGMPRNDLLFANNEQKNILKKKVRDYYGIEKSEKLLLYSPTFRGNTHSSTGIDGEHLDWNETRKALKKRFSGNWRLMFRGHYHSKESFGEIDGIIDASSYPDMQDLIIASDAMITDYSSVIWDYSLTGKPGFLFCPDLNAYVRERDFYSPIESWPYHYSIDNNELRNIILNYDEKDALRRSSNYQKQMKSFEDGSASIKVVDIVKIYLQLSKQKGV